MSYILTTVCSTIMFYEVEEDLSLEKKITNTLFFIFFALTQEYWVAITSVQVCIYDISKSLNTCFSELIFNSETKNLKKLRTISRCFTQICSLCKKFSIVFSYVNANTSLAAFIFIGVENYCVFSFFKTPNMKTFNMLLFSSLWAISLSIYFTGLMIYSELINQQCDETLHILQRISPRKYQDKDYKRVSIFIQQLSHSSYEITCGSFKLNRNFLFDFFVSIFSISLVFFQLYGMNK